METKNYAITFYHNVELVFLQIRMNEYQKLTKTLGNIKKIADLIKNAKIRDIKKWKSIPLLLEDMQCPINKPKRRLPHPWNWKNWKKWWKFSKTWKKCKFVQKIC